MKALNHSFERTLQSKKCLSIEQLSKHEIELKPVSKDAFDSDIDMDCFFKTDSISYLLNEIFENRNEIEITSISKEIDSSFTLTFLNPSNTHKRKLEKDGVSQCTVVSQN